MLQDTRAIRRQADGRGEWDAAYQRLKQLWYDDLKKILLLYRYYGIKGHNTGNNAETRERPIHEE